MAAFLLIISAVSGYLFSDRCLKLKYSLPREDGQRFYLRSLLYGLPFLFSCIFISKLLFWLPDLFSSIPVLFIVDNDTELLLMSGCVLFISFVSAEVYNLYIGVEGRKQKFIDAMMKDDFERILYESMEKLHPVAISLESRKVYVGLVYDGIEPGSGNSSYLTIIPFLSGYRDKDTLSFTIQTKYDRVLDLFTKDDDVLKGKDNVEAEGMEQISHYSMAFPRNKIISIHLYNDHLYKNVQDQIDPD